jgi:hypothetical protein
VGSDPVVKTVTREIPSLETGPTLARHFLRATLETWKLDGLGDVTELLTGELVSNAVRHVGSGATVRALRRPWGIRVEVDDASTEAPAVGHAALTDVHGRGMLLVDTLADAWGTELRDNGKTVWFEIDTRNGNPREKPRRD